MGFAEMAICVDHVEVLKPACKFTLAMLADRADPFEDAEKTVRRTDGRVECWPSVQDLMHRTCQSRSTVLRQLKELEELGLIEIKKRWRRDDNGQARQATNKYILNLPDMLAGKFRAPMKDMGVKMTPKQPVGKTAGQGKSVKMRPKGDMGVKNRDYMGVNSDTPIKDQGLNTTPSPTPPMQVPDVGGDEGIAVGAPVGAGDGLDVSPNAIDVASAAAQPAAPEPPAALSKEAKSLLFEAVPAEMLQLTAAQQRVIAQLVADRVEAGWTPQAVYQQLSSRPLPPEVRNLFGLVKSRFVNDVPVDDPPVQVPAHVGATPLLDAEGRTLDHFAVDWGAVAIDHRRAQARGDAEGVLDRRQFALAVGIQKYLLTSTY